MRFTYLVLTLFFLTLVDLPSQTGTPAQQLFGQAQAELNAGDFAKAGTSFAEFMKKYPSDPSAPQAQLSLGICLLYQNKYEEALVELVKAGDSRNTADVRDTAVFFKGQAQLSQAGGMPATEAKRKPLLEATLATFAAHLKDFPKSATREDSYYGRSYAHLMLDKYDDVKKEVDLLLSEFPQSPNKPDYLLLVGNAYQQQVVELDRAKKPEAEILAATKLAIEAYEKIQATPEFLVAANDARLQTAELLFGLAETPQDWRKIVDTYRQVQSKEILIPAQEKIVASIGPKIRDAALSQNKVAGDQLRSQLRRQRSRLEELNQRPDPLLQATIRMAQARLKVREFDEARVQLRRAQKFVTDDQKASVSYMLILSYALQGETQKADQAFTVHKQSFPTDTNSENISALIGIELQKQGDHNGAVAQFRRSLQEYPQGKLVAQASVGLASSLIELKQIDEASRTLTEFIAKNPQSPLRYQAQYGFAKGLLSSGKMEEAVVELRKLSADKTSGNYQASSAMLIASAYLSAKRYAEAAKEFIEYGTKFPADPSLPQALYYGGVAQLQAKDLVGARATLTKYLEGNAKHQFAPAAAEYLGDIAQMESKTPEMLAAYEKVTKDYPEAPQAISSSFKIGQYYEKLKQLDQAAETYQKVAQNPASLYAPVAQLRIVMLWFGSARSLGSFPALNDEEKKTWQSSTTKAEAATLEALQRFPLSPQTGTALQELVKAENAKVNFGLFTEEQAVDSFRTLAQGLSDPKVKARVELAGAGIYALRGKLPEARKIYEKTEQAQGLAVFAWEDLDRYGAALFAVKEFDTALKIYATLQSSFEKEKFAQAAALYGQGAIYMLKGDTAQADKLFSELEKKYPWSEKIMEAKLGRGAAAEGRGENQAARDFYQAVIRDTQPRSTSEMKARAMLGFARTLEKEGNSLPDPVDKNKPNALNNYYKIDALFDSATGPASEALWRAGQICEKANMTKDARQAYVDLLKKYPQSDWAPKAKERVAALPAAK